MRDVVFLQNGEVLRVQEILVPDLRTIRPAGGQLAEIEALGRKAILVQADLADPLQAAGLIPHVLEHGRLFALINNAAIEYDTDQRASSADLDRIHLAMETNLFGAWRTVLAFLPLLRESPHGRIVNVSSESGSLVSRGEHSPGAPYAYVSDPDGYVIELMSA